MVFTHRLREGIRRGRVRCSVRIWMQPRVKVGARESGFDGATDLLGTARHGGGDNVYLIRFHYLPPGGWDVHGHRP